MHENAVNTSASANVCRRVPVGAYGNAVWTKRADLRLKSLQKEAKIAKSSPAKWKS